MAKIKLLQEKEDREPVLLSITTNYFQVYTVHSFLGKPRIKEILNLRKMLEKGAEVEQEPALGLWVEQTDSHFCSCSKL